MYLEFLLIGFLVILMYYQPAELKVALQTILGKIIAIMIVATIAMYGGRHSGLLAAIIFIMLLHVDREGFEDTAKGKKKTKKKEGLKPTVAKNAAPVISKKPVKKPTKKSVKTTKKSTTNKIPILSVMNQLDLDRQIKTKALQNSQSARSDNSGAANGTYQKSDV